MASPVAQMVKRLPTMPETRVQSLDCEDPLEKEMAAHSSILAWKIPWMEEPGRLQSMGHKESDTTERLHFTSLHYNYLYTLAFLTFLFSNKCMAYLVTQYFLKFSSDWPDSKVNKWKDQMLFDQQSCCLVKNCYLELLNIVFKSW